MSYALILHLLHATVGSSERYKKKQASPKNKNKPEASTEKEYKGVV